MHRRDLSDPEWAVLAPYFPATPARPGGQWKDHRTILSGIFHRLRTGCPWRDLPGRFGPWQTVYERFYNLRRSGRLAELLAALQLRLNDAGRLVHPGAEAEAAELEGQAGLVARGDGGEPSAGEGREEQSAAEEAERVGGAELRARV